MNPYDDHEHQGKRADQVEFSATVCFWCFAAGTMLAVGVWLWRVLQ